MSDQSSDEEEEEAVGASQYHNQSRQQRSASPFPSGSSPAPSTGLHSDILPVPLRGFIITNKESHPNYETIGDSQKMLAPFNLDQLRGLQGELAQIGTQANHTLHQLEREKAELEKWLTQFKNYTGSTLSDFDMEDSQESSVPSPMASSKAEERGSTRIRTTTP